MHHRRVCVLAVVVGGLACNCFAEHEGGFVSLFNGRDLSGWTGAVTRFKVEDGLLIYPTGGGRDGNIYTEKEYDNFILRFEFRLTTAANNGIGIRTPMEGNPALVGYEIQILDDTAEIFRTRKRLKPYQYHGSIYMIAPAKRGYLKPVGEWNFQEIVADGDRITVNLNGTTIVDRFDVSSYGRPMRGHIALLGHHSEVHFHSIRVKELEPRKPTRRTLVADNVAPGGFISLFDGTTLDGWKGLLAQPYDNPSTRHELSEEELTRFQAEAARKMVAHWKVENGTIACDGKGASICTVEEYGDCELRVDWRIGEKGSGGISLRGLVQVQIGDRSEGSGAIRSGKKTASKPLMVADHPVGQWNSLVITMNESHIFVVLNGKLVVNGMPVMNPPKSGEARPARGPIELQAHGSAVWFKNIYIRELRSSTANAGMEKQ